MKGSKREVIAETWAGEDGSLDLHSSSGELRGLWVFIYKLEPMEFAARSDVGVKERGSNVDSKMLALSSCKMELPFTEMRKWG